MDSPCLLAARADAGQHSAGRWPRPRQEGGTDVPIRDILRNNVKEKLKRDEVVASMTVRLVRSMEIARIARTAGFDSLYVDIEHSSFSLDTCAQICMAALEAGIAPFVRVPANTPDYVSRVLDGGALGQISSARRAIECRRPAASAFPLLSGGRGLRRAQRRHHGHRAIRERRGARARRGDRGGRRRRHGAGGPQRSVGGPLLSASAASQYFTRRSLR